MASLEGEQSQRALPPGGVQGQRPRPYFLTKFLNKGPYAWG